MNWSIFGTNESRYETMEEPDRMSLDAAEMLFLEQVRGVMIEVINLFKYLQRLTEKRPDDFDDDTYQFILERVIKECAVCDTPLSREYPDIRIAAIDRIEKTVSDIMPPGSVPGDMEDDLEARIGYLATHNGLPEVIDRLSGLVD